MMEKLAPYRVFTSSSLKLIAVITMFIDHFGATVMGQAVLRLPAVRADAGLYQNMLLLYRLIRYIGRIAFPIYCFLLVEGFLHTRNKMKYLLRLGIFVLIRTSKMYFSPCFSVCWSWYWLTVSGMTGCSFSSWPPVFLWDGSLRPTTVPEGFSLSAPCSWCVTPARSSVWPVLSSCSMSSPHHWHSSPFFFITEKKET